MKHALGDLTAYLDDALAPAARDAVEAHLTRCPGCRAERDRLTATLALLARLPPAPAPSPTFEARFHARLAAGGARGRERRGFLDGLAWRWMAPGLATAAVAVSALVAVRDHRAHERAVAEHLDLFEEYEVVASVGTVDSAEDADVVAHLDEAAVRP